jgi:ParB-like chromosome segregation protein Spo0J
VLANEVFKDQDYFLSNENVIGMIQKLKSGAQTEPIMVIQHPEDEDKFLILDGHHRRFAYEYSNRLEVPARIVAYDNILLADENGKVISSLDKELGNKELLDKYFVSPSGEHGFEKED